MKSYIRGTLPLLVLAFAPACLAAQQPGMQGPPTAIAGVVQDAQSGTGLATASVEIYSQRDSGLVTGALTDESGRFLIPGVMPGQYYARITYIGYEVKVVDGIQVSPAAPRADLGVIALATSALELEGITVEGERSAVQLAVDRTIYNTQEMPATAGGTATDVLRNVPAVEVDIDGNVSLRGNSNVAIQINGRPAPMRGQALTNFLQQLPASMVQRVEVVPNPSAAHDPEGMGGIINIVLQQNADLGLSYGVNAGVGTGGRWNGSGNVGYQAGALALTGSYGFMANEREQEGFMLRTDLFPETIRFDDQTIGGDQSMGGHNGSLSAEYKLGERDFLTGSANFNAFGFENSSINEYVRLECAAPSEIACARDERIEIDRWDVLGDAEFANTNLGGAFGYRHTVEPQRDEIIGEVRYNFSRDETPSALRDVPGASSAREARLFDVDQNTDQTELTATLDWITPIGSAFKLESGYKGTLRGIDNDYHAETLVGDPLVLESTTDDDFTYDETINALYGVGTRDFGRVDLQGGLRVEHTATEFEGFGVTGTSTNDYFSLIPSGALLFELAEGGMESLRASYSRRISRPQGRQVNPLPIIQDEFSRFVGNPELGPEYTDAFELTWNKILSWGSVQLTPFYRHQSDIMRQIITVDTATSIRTATFENAASSDQYGADATTSLRFGPFNGFVSLSGYHQSTDASNIQAGLSSEGFSWNARVSLGYRLTESTDLQYFHFYRGPQELEQGRVSAFEFSNFAIRQKLFENATLTLRVMDPFDRMGFSFHTADENQIVDSERSFGMRAIFLQFSYSWGQQPRIRQRPQDMQQQGGQEAPDAGVGIQ